MNHALERPRSVEEFFVWNEGREGKREFVRGKVVEIPNDTTRAHSRVCSHLLFEITRQLDRRRYDFGLGPFGVQTIAGIRFPDLIVEKRVPESKVSDLVARHPILLAEVLSPSSSERDFAEKAEEYQTLPTLRHYLVLSQDEAKIWIWSRVFDDWLEPEVVSGASKAIKLRGLDVEIDLAAVFQGIVNGP